MNSRLHDRRRAVLVVGGYGVFGGRLARLLIERGDLRVLVAGRSIHAALTFCAQHGGEPLALDLQDDLDALLARLQPLVVVDAAGPFQSYVTDPYRLARAALLAGSHYLDLSDDAGFAGGITTLDADARQAQRVAISGASSVPAISAAAVRELCAGLGAIEVIETLILPGNRAPRGMSVMRAILAQVGRPLKLWRGGAWTRAIGWDGLRRDRLSLADGSALRVRWTSWIGSPDLHLFPQHFHARSVLFRAGLELSLLHLGLWALSFLPRLRVLRSLEPWAHALRWIADRLQVFGTDRGGMQVRVIARDAQGRAVRRTWTLLAESGAGPWVPALPAACLIDALVREQLVPGARPCLDELCLAQIAAAGSRLAIRFGRDEQPAPTLYERVLGPHWSRLPPAIRQVHAVFDRQSFRGEARITTGPGWMAGVIRRCMRFPPAAERSRVRVTMERRGETERWTREFGEHRFASTLSIAANDPPGVLRERFGLLRFRVQLPADEQGLAMPLLRADVLGIPLPRSLTPTSDTREFVDELGRFCFDVDVSLPGIGRIVRYEGWLRPETFDLPAGDGLG